MLPRPQLGTRNYHRFNLNTLVAVIRMSHLTRNVLQYLFDTLYHLLIVATL